MLYRVLLKLITTIGVRLLWLWDMFGKDIGRKYYSDKLYRKVSDIGKGCEAKGMFKITDYDQIKIGNNVHIGNNAYFDSKGGIKIGDNTHISRNVTIYSSIHNYEGAKLPYDDKLIIRPVSIGKNVWIGMNASIMGGVNIGDGVIIGLGCVVTKDVPSLTIVGGQPFRVLKMRNAEHYRELEAEGKYGKADGE